jgi:large subunit ribosomal protein L15
MLRLDSITSVKKKRKRVGRGGSRGGTSGKGHKGQKARSGGYVRPGFEGGQMPLYRRLPKRGFNNTEFQIGVETVNIGLLEQMFNDGAQVTKEVLIEKKFIKPRKSSPFMLKILGNGTLTKKLTVITDKISAGAKQAIEQAGGQVTLVTKDK